MKFALGPNGRITQLAVGQHLPLRTVRARLTIIYGGVFLLSGAALMAIAYLLLVNAGFVFSLQSGHGAGPVGGAETVSASARAVGVTNPRSPLVFPAPGSRTHPSAQTMAHWRRVAQCMRTHGIADFPFPTSSVPRTVFGLRQLSERDGATFAIPAAINTQSAVFTRAVTACGFNADYTTATAEANRRRTGARQALLIQAGIALAVMTLISLGVGWLMAGRVLQPLEDAYHAQRQFVANASHELRAPLTRLRTLSEVALASPNTSLSSLRAAHERVLASEQHLEQLIDGLLTLTRGQSGLERRERVDLATLTSQALLARASQLAEFDVRATLDTAPAAGDQRLLERLIANLIDNAIRHNATGGQIEISTGAYDRQACLTISNTGAAVPMEEIQRLFAPFQRLDAVRTRHNDGHGLGLSIVQAIANAHGAEMTACARAKGGLTIELRFPAMTGPSAPLTFAATPTRRGTTSEVDLPAQR